MKTTVSATEAWRPNVSVHSADDVIPDALVLQTSTVSGAIQGDEPTLRVAYVDDAQADFVAEGEVIPESEPTLAEAVIRTGKVSVLVPLSREQFGQDGTDKRIAASVARAVTTKANWAYLRQPVGVDPEDDEGNAIPTWHAPQGILTNPGLIVGDNVTTSLDPIVDALAEVEANGATPSHIVTDPHGWAYLRKLKTATDTNVSLIGAGVTDALPMLFNLPVIVTPAVPTNSLAVLDSTAIVSAVSQLEVAVSEHAYFNRDSIACRCTWRFGAQLMRPNRIAICNIGEANNG